MRKPRSTMTMKILLLCIASILAALFIQTALFQNSSTRTIYEQTKEANLHSLQNMKEDIGDVLKQMESSLIQVYNEEQLMEDLRAHQEIGRMRENNYRVAYNMAIRSFKAGDKVVAIYIYDDFNRIVSAYRHASTPVYNYPEDIFADTAAYNVRPLREFMNKDGTVMLVSSYYNESRERDIVRFALNIFNRTGQRDQIGCVVCDVDSAVFQDILEKYAYDNNNVVWIQPEGDRPLVSAGGIERNYQDEYEGIVDKVRKGKTGEELNQVMSQGVLFQLAPERYNLQIFSLMPSSLLMENQKVLNRNLAVIAVALIAVFGAISVMTAQGITRPLRYLTGTMRRIRDGDTGLRVKTLGRDEIGELGETFNEMLDEMENLIAREYQAKLMTQRAEYKALQAQINPHFLYNTLNTMSSIAQVNNCPTVSAMCESLSNIFRYSLDMKNPLSTVEKEILHLKNFLYVMNIRLQEEINYDVRLGEDVLKDCLPRLTLQPIVENSLKYGIRKLKGEKRIGIRVEAEEGCLRIEVSDNGVGMDARELNRQLEENNLDYVEKGDSIGLHNINARIRLMFGDGYGVRMDSSPGGGTTVTVTLPEVKEGEAGEWKTL